MLTDVVGYSRMVEQDEVATLAELKALREAVIDPLLARYHGRLVKLMGDGAMVEFASVVEAVSCAVAIQQGVAAGQIDVEENRRIVLRIGINLGDVLVEGDDLLGDGVNVAARLEQIAAPGEILVSGTTHEHLKGKVNFALNPLGERTLKNISEPVRVFRVDSGGQPRPTRPPITPRPWWGAAAFGGLLALLLVPGAWWIWPDAKPVAAESIAVLPFTNMSGDPSQDHLGAGVAEEIITMLSAFPGLRVTSRMSSFAFDAPTKIQIIGQELGVRYVLEGSVRRSGDGIRVTAQLIDAASGDHVWASNFDRAGEDILAIQADVAEKIYASTAGLMGEVRNAESLHAWRKSAPDLEEYDYYLRGHQLFMTFTLENRARAAAIWEEGLSGYPDSAILRIKLAFYHWIRLAWGLSENPDAETELAWQLVTEAMAQQDKSRLEAWLGHWSMANLYPWHNGDFEAAAAEAEAAVALVPYDPISRGDLAYVLATGGRTDQAIAWALEAIERDPTGPYFYKSHLAWAYYLGGQYEQAAVTLAQLARPQLTLQAANYVRLDRIELARAAIADLLERQPDWSLRKEAAQPLRESLKKGYLDDLRTAGAPG